MAAVALVPKLELVGSELDFIRKESLTSVVKRELERMILNGDLKAGE
ncbi:MAG: hypothetical protein HN578_21515, partial [Rhodospirillales bacterium]|nr:hypothetical protein [Rhodospirillales bacterium]